MRGARLPLLLTLLIAGVSAQSSDPPQESVEAEAASGPGTPARSPADDGGASWILSGIVILCLLLFVPIALRFRNAGERGNL